MKNIIILSSKSAGSTALQDYLKINLGYKTVKFTQHQEEETLYWNKVASVLGMEQEPMYRSVVPIEKEKALKQLNFFFKKNDLEDIKCTTKTSEDEFLDYYFRLIKKMGPNFVEKSPHHLYSEASLELIEKFKKRYACRVEVVVIGLVRHPQAVLFSAWNRWKYLPKLYQQQWKISYDNYLKWEEKLDIKTVKYEDLVTYQVDIPALIGEEIKHEKFKFRISSKEKWKDNSSFGFELSDDVKKLAKSFGYKDFNTENTITWQYLNYTHTMLEKAKSILHSKN